MSRLKEAFQIITDALSDKEYAVLTAKQHIADLEKDNAQLRAEIERLRAGLNSALDMTESFASGAGFSASGAAEFLRLRALALPKPPC